MRSQGLHPPLLLFLACLTCTVASADLRPAGPKHQVGRGAASSAETSPGVPVQCTDVETGSSFHYQAQHLLSSGAVDQQWVPDSTEHCMGSNNGYRGRPIYDGQGGEYFSWVDTRSGESDIYVQHLTAAGDTLAGWTRGGLPVCMAPFSQYNLDATSDAQGGLLLAWQDFRSARSSVVYCARVTPAGSIASGWGADGIALGEASAEQLTPRITADGEGGAFVFWLERESVGLALRVQHVAASGSVAAGWPGGGVELVPGAQRVAGISAIADSAGTTSLFWRSSPDSNGLVLRKGRLGSGTIPDSTWINSGQQLSALPGAASDPVLVREASGGLLAAWSELSGTSNALRLEKFAPDGTIAAGWPQPGILLASEGVGMSPPALLSDGGQNVLVAWEDRRTGAGDIRAQRVGGDGIVAPMWGNDVLVCDAHGEQYAPMLAPDGNGGAIVTWIDDASAASAAYISGASLAAEALPRFLRAETNSGYARLIWSAGAAPGMVVHAYRQDGETNWTQLAQLAADDSSHLVLEDRSAPAGANARYRLSVESNGQEMFLTPVAVFIPSDPTALALDRAWAPSNGNFIAIEFALPRGPEARAEIFDVTGRRVGDLSLASFAPGTYRTNVPFTTRARSGVFFLRLSQGSRAISRRVLLVR